MLDELCEGDTELHQDLIALFAHQSQASLAQIARAIQTADAEAVQHEAHQLKGSSANMGALRMAELSDRLCEAERGGVLNDAPEHVEELERALAELERASELPRAAWNVGL